MPGFDNDVVYAANLDFSGGDPVTGKVTTDGQILIGATASPNIRVGSLTSTGGTLTITPGAGTLNVEAAGVKITSPGAYPYTTISQDELILVDTLVARTIIPLASPISGQKHIIKDNVGSAISNNITVTPSGKNIDGAESFIMNINYGSITIVYNGVQWSII